MKRTLMIAMLVVACVVCVARSEEIRVERGIKFAQAGGVELLGDLYIPPGEGPFPGILYIHGGGFVAGSRDYKTQVQTMRWLAESGFVTFSADYRLLQQGGVFPNNIKDVKCALCWLKTHGAEYGMDPARVGAFGGSAGGYLVGAIAVTAGLEDFAADCEAAEGVDDGVLVAVALYPPVDMTKMKGQLARFLISEIKRATKIKSKKKLWKLMKKFSLNTYADRSVPIMLIHGDADVLVPVEQSRLFKDTLEKAGREVEYYEAAGAVHGFMSDYFDTEEAKIGRERSLAFLKKHLSAKDETTQKH